MPANDVVSPSTITGYQGACRAIDGLCQGLPGVPLRWLQTIPGAASPCKHQPQVGKPLASFPKPPLQLSDARCVIEIRVGLATCACRNVETQRSVGLSGAWQVESAIPAGINFLTVPDNTQSQPQCDRELQTPRDAAA